MSSDTLLQSQKLQFSYDGERSWSFPDILLSSGQKKIILGPSGCGKSTLMHLLAGLLTPQKGRVLLCGENLYALSSGARDKWRGTHIGIVFQKPQFIDSLTIRQNIELASRLGSRKPSAINEYLLDLLGLRLILNNRINQLSEGEKQRVSIARALQHGPALLMADEPTSALDDDHCARVLDLLVHAADSMGTALLIVTHDHRVKARIDDSLILSSS